MREVMTLGSLRGAHVVAGEGGLDRVVTGVNVMEVPDIEAFVKDGELLLTTAYPVRERPERLAELVPELARRGLAGLAVKPLRYLDGLPERLITEADRLAFPVVVLRDDTSFNEVIGAVLAVVLADHGAEPGSAEVIRERLTAVALAGGGLEEIARTLAGALNRDVTIVDDEWVVLGSGLGADRVDEQPPLAHRRGEERAHRPWEFPVTVAGVQRGRVLVGGQQEPSLGQRRLIRQSCFAAGMHLAQAFASFELDRRLRVLFLEELVTGPAVDEPVLRQRAGLFGWNLVGDHVVLLSLCHPELPEAAISAAAQHALPRRSLAWSRGQEVVAIVPVEESHESVSAGSRGPGLRWRDALRERGAEGVIVSVGSRATSLLDLAQSHSAAREALRVAQVTGRDVVRHDRLMLERLLLAVPGDLLREFVDKELGQLVSYDEANGANLCSTLEVYLGVGNGAEAARRLFIHYNTMKYRLARIHELVCADLHDPRDRLGLALALEARKLL